jgi:hypothetical protein
MDERLHLKVKVALHGPLPLVVVCEVFPHVQLVVLRVLAERRVAAGGETSGP